MRLPQRLKTGLFRELQTMRLGHLGAKQTDKLGDVWNDCAAHYI